MENDKRNCILENEKISRLLLNLSMPAMVGMIVNALYNLVDTIFIGRGVGTQGIAGLTIAFPIQMIVMSFALMIGIGGASAFSRSLGERNVKKANFVAGNVFVSSIVISFIVATFGIAFTDEILIAFGATKGVLPYAKDYMKIIFIGTYYFPLFVSSNNIVRAEGNAKSSMFAMIISTGINIALDPIFIFGLGMGMKGAAIATAISQFCGLLYMIFYFFGSKTSIQIGFSYLRPRYEILYEILTVGFASFARQVAGSIVAFVLNNMLKVYGGYLALAVLGVVNRLLMFLLMPLFGVVQGMQPIAGFNYGAKRLDRVKEVVKLSIMVVCIYSTVSFAIIEIMPRQLMMIFSDDIELIDSGAKVVRIVVLMLPIIGVQVVGATFFQSIGKALPSLLLSLLRQVFLFIPLVLILPKYFGIWGIWVTFPIADFFSTLITVFLVKGEISRLDIQFEKYIKAKEVSTETSDCEK